MGRSGRGTRRGGQPGLALGAVLLTGCMSGLAGSPASAPVVAPGWMAKLPEGGGQLCAVGTSGPTYYAEDARQNSVKIAMAELARAREVRVQAGQIIVESGGTKEYEASVEGHTNFTSDVVLQNAQVREQWVHPGGDERYGPKGTVYTLVCMPLGGR